jgi:hypothetical protein
MISMTCLWVGLIGLVVAQGINKVIELSIEGLLNYFDISTSNSVQHNQQKSQF